MARELHACFVRYFARLEKLDDKWKELSKKAERPLEILANRTEQFRHVTNEEIDGAGNSVDGEARGRLTFKILMGLEEEITLLSDILIQLNDANQDLKNYLVNLENARSKVSLKDETMRELIKGTPYRPTLDLLLQWAVEGFQFFHNIYLHISDCMKSIDYKIEETVDNLISSFMEDKRGRKNINRTQRYMDSVKQRSSNGQNHANEDIHCSRMAINHDLSFTLSPYPRCLSLDREGLACGFAFRESRRRKRGVEAPAPAIDSLGYIRGFKSYYHQRMGVSPVVNHSSTADKILARFLLWSPAGWSA